MMGTSPPTVEAKAESEALGLIELVTHPKVYKAKLKKMTDRISELNAATVKHAKAEKAALEASYKANTDRDEATKAITKLETRRTDVNHQIESGQKDLQLRKDTFKSAAAETRVAEAGRTALLDEREAGIAEREKITADDGRRAADALGKAETSRDRAASANARADDKESAAQIKLNRINEFLTTTAKDDG